MFHVYLHTIYRQCSLTKTYQWHHRFNYSRHLFLFFQEKRHAHFHGCCGSEPNLRSRVDHQRDDKLHPPNGFITHLGGCLLQQPKTQTLLHYGSVPHVPGFLINKLPIKTLDLSCKPKHKGIFPLDACRFSHLQMFRFSCTCIQENHCSFNKRLIYLCPTI